MNPYILALLLWFFLAIGLWFGLWFSLCIAAGVKCWRREVRQENPFKEVV